MLFGAKAFNQNLCAWKDKFPYGFEGSDAVFDGSGCTYIDRPRRSNPFGGPFCAYDCAPTMAPTVSHTSVAFHVRVFTKLLHDG